MIEQYLNSDFTVFKNTEVFKETYIIQDIRFRDDQIKELALTLRPALKNTTPQHMLLWGLPGTGKTATVRLVLRELAKKTTNIIPVYVNCQNATTPTAVISSIFETVSESQLPSGGKSLNTLCKRLGTLISSRGKIIILHLDEINHLSSAQYTNETLARLLRLHLSFPDVRIAIIATVSDPKYEVGELLDASTRSVFSHNEILYPTYSEEEMATILKDRVSMGYNPDTISDDLVKNIARTAFTTSNLRTSITLLYQSGHHAELAGRTTIEEKDVRAVVEDVKNLHLHHLFDTLPPAEKTLIYPVTTVLERTDDCSPSGEETGTSGNEPEPMTNYRLFQTLTDKTGLKISYSSFSEHIRHFALLGLIDTHQKSLPTRGRVTEILPRYEAGDIKKICESGTRM